MRPVKNALIRQVWSIFRGAPELEVLDAAVRLDRVIVTYDYRDFSYLAQAMHRARRPFPGLAFVSSAIRQRDVGGLVRAIEGLVAASPDLPASAVVWLIPGGERKA